MDIKSLAINLRVLRESKHLKQEYIAEQIGVSPATYSKIENGKIKLSTVRLQQIAHVLRVPISTLFSERKETFSTDLEETIRLQRQQLLERDQKIVEFEQERARSIEREQYLLNYIKILELQTK
ncbi:transcriptional regulator with XRE-family HTH domain [Spirosoma lacussanchae]|uniref:helix-turn-helix domain-containing protein n=1 Tax=Spirosoma lacussanchae TaxID=1884249 RepID=UPI001108BF56|nr:helix-turn-helix domain-containing protein [Spirosoma lacussanchae]